MFNKQVLSLAKKLNLQGFCMGISTWFFTINLRGCIGSLNYPHSKGGEEEVFLIIKQNKTEVAHPWNWESL